jgi:hypothetical protein
METSEWCIADGRGNGNADKETACSLTTGPQDRRCRSTGRRRLPAPPRRVAYVHPQLWRCLTAPQPAKRVGTGTQGQVIPVEASGSRDWHRLACGGTGTAARRVRPVREDRRPATAIPACVSGVPQAAISNAVVVLTVSENITHARARSAKRTAERAIATGRLGVGGRIGPGDRKGAKGSTVLVIEAFEREQDTSR